MSKNFPLIIISFVILICYSCSKKIIPVTTLPSPVEKYDSVVVLKKSDSAVTVKKAVVKKKPKITIPKVITVNDKAAKLSVDGRFYYDLQGHRYWRNNVDGKYYLYNKSMSTDPAYKKQ